MEEEGDGRRKGRVGGEVKVEGEVLMKREEQERDGQEKKKEDKESIW